MLLLVAHDIVFLEEAERSLRELGTPVLAAADGISAVTAVRTVPQIRVVLLVNDVPGLPVAALVAAMRKFRPDLTIIAVAGLLPEYVLGIAKSAGTEPAMPMPVASEVLAGPSAGAAGA